ncbi:MAG: hypothetical protein ACR2J4_10180 [Deinococcus sp.]
MQAALSKANKIPGYAMLLAQSSKVSPLPNQVSWWGQWDSFVTQQIRRAITEEKSADDTINAMTDKWTELKAKFNK